MRRYREEILSCDRCKNIIPDRRWMGILKVPNPKTKVTIFDALSTTDGYKYSYDLCESCAYSIISYAKGQEEGGIYNEFEQKKKKEREL